MQGGLTSGQTSRQKPGTTSKGQQRSFAFENLVSPLEPSAFEIRVLDSELNPFTDIEFNVKVDTATVTKKTGSDGIFKVLKPKNVEIRLFFKE